MRKLFVSLACGLGYLLLAGKLVEDDAFTQGTFVLSACLLAAYALLLYAWKKGKEKQPADSSRISERLQSPCWRWSLLNPPTTWR